MQNPLLGGRYRRDHVIGRGAMGEVWLAHDELLDRTVAVKTVSSGGALNGLATPVRDDLLARIMREARLAARMNHPHAVSVFDLVVEDGQPNVVMEYVQGRTFADEIRASGALDPVRVAEVGAPVAGALAQAHELDITHRDVKPANILITTRGLPKLADFGVAKVNGDAGVTTTGFLLGTPAFIAPEVARGAVADARSDVWSLGATLYAALRGRSPFQQTGSEDALVVLGRLISQPVPPLGDGPVAHVVMRMLDADPARRPTAQDVSDLLLDAGRRSSDADRTYVPPPVADGPAYPAGESTAARWSQPTELRALLGSSDATSPTRSGGGRRTAALIAVAALVVAVVALAVVFVTHRGDSTAAGRTSVPTSTPTPGVVTVTASGRAPAGVAASGITSAPDTATPDTAPPSDDAAVYTAPYGLSVDAPAGWTEDDFFGVASTREYVDGADHFEDAYIHVGVGNKKTLPRWQDEINGAVSALQDNTQYTDVVVQPPVAESFRGTERAGDIEFTETNKFGVRRHAIERIWSEHNRTYIIQLNAPADRWPSYRPVFTQMTQTCDVTG